jgi:hypothetical protein
VSSRTQGDLSFNILENAPAVAVLNAATGHAYFVNKGIQANREFVIPAPQAAVQGGIARQRGARLKHPRTQQSAC